MLYAQSNLAFCKKQFTSMLTVGLIQGILSIVLGVTDMVLAGHFFGVPGVSAVTVAVPLSSTFRS